MAFETGTITNASGSFSLAHQNFLERLKNQLSSSVFMGAANVWVVERYVVTGDFELIVRGPGLGGTDQIYMGIKLYHDVGADYYNCKVAGFTGYAPNNSFETQPGISGNLGVPLHNLSITYWLIANGQRFAVAAKVGTPVYESFYLGKFLPYATPGQYPYPVVAAGMLTSAALTRFSDTAQSMPYKGNRVNLQMRFVDGVWKQPTAWPWTNADIAGATVQLRESPTDTYPLLPVILTDTAPNIYGELDGIFHVSGFNNAVENLIQISGVDYLVMQDVYRTSHIDYYAMRLN